MFFFQQNFKGKRWHVEELYLPLGNVEVFFKLSHKLGMPIITLTSQEGVKMSCIIIIQHFLFHNALYNVGTVSMFNIFANIKAQLLPYFLLPMRFMG